MTGIQHIEVSGKRAKFKFDIFRNITVVHCERTQSCNQFTAFNGFRERQFQDYGTQHT